MLEKRSDDLHEEVVKFLHEAKKTREEQEKELKDGDNEPEK